MNQTGAINFVFSEAVDWPEGLATWNSTTTNDGADALNITITSLDTEAVEIKFDWDVTIESNNTFTV
jgi:hypothetical protein